MRRARSGARLTPVAVVALLAPLVFFLAPAVLGSVASQTLIAPLFGTREALNASAVTSGLVFTLAELLSYVTAILLVWLWLRAYEGRSLVSAGLEPGGALGRLGRGALISFAAFTAWLLIAYASGAVVLEASAPQLVGWRALGGVLIASVGVFAAAAAEEAIFRGWALPVISARMGPALGVTSSAVLFALPHRSQRRHYAFDDDQYWPVRVGARALGALRG